MTMNRRDFIKCSAFGAAGTLGLLPRSGWSAEGDSVPAAMPTYLKGYEALYAQDPRKAAVQWFMAAKYGLFMHYGVYSQLADGEWVQFRKQIRVKEYEKLKDTFNPVKFDADAITEVALAAGMKYITLTTRHHDSFCLWDTKQTDFKSTNSPAKRDLVAELTAQCQRKGLGMCYYYSYGRDWRHQDSVFDLKVARPAYNPPDPWYHTGADYDMSRYVAYVNAQITELLTAYGPVAAIWFDAPPEAAAHQDIFKPQETYDLIHRLQPQCLVSAKWGITGTEDFNAPEHGQFLTNKAAMVAARKRGVPLEICETLSGGWGYKKGMETKNKGLKGLREMLAFSAQFEANLLLNLAPLPDGSLIPIDVEVLKQMGEELKAKGFPLTLLEQHRARIAGKILGQPS